MGVGEKLKDIYYTGEEQWYHFWDKVDAHVPIYKIIDPIDSVIPSFALFLILIFVLLLLAGYALFGLVVTTPATLKLTVVDSEGSPVSGAKVTLSGIDQTYYSNEYGLIEDITVPFMATISVTAEKDDKKTTIPILVDETEKIAQVQLPIPRISFSQKTIRFVNSENPNETTSGELTVRYTCSTGNDSATPTGGTIYTSTISLSVSDECGVLSVEVTSPKYETKNFTLTAASTTIPLTPKAPTATVRVTVQLKYNGQLVNDQILVQAFKGSTALIPIDSETAIAGQAQFTLPEGDYKFKSVMDKGYKETITPIITITKSTTAPITINLEKNYVGFIKVQTKEGSTILTGTHVYLSKRNTTTGILTQIIAKDTNDTGEVTFELAEAARYVITATKDYYCDKTVDANAGESIILNMQRATSTCASKLKVKVIAQDGKPVAYAKAALFGQKGEDTYQLPYPEIITDYNGSASWPSIRSTTAGETFKVFAFKATYSGWSDEKEFSSLTAVDPFKVTLTVPSGTVKVIVTDNDAQAIQFAQVQLFDEYLGDEASGKRLIENVDGSIEFTTKADKKVYAVIKKEGYESYTTLPQQVIGDGTITFNVALSKPPVNALVVNQIGVYKNGASVLKVEPNQEYDVLFEVIAPKAYDELGFFARVGQDNITKTELDKLFIKSVNAPGEKTTLFGSTYNKPKGYNTDSQYTNLEESKWAQIKWIQGGYEPGKIIVSTKIKVRPNAQQDETLEVWFRAWGVESGAYERDLADSELGTAQSSSTKQELYALAKPIYLSVGTETLCDSPAQERAFCTTSTYTDLTDPRLIVNSFDGTFDAKNNTPYSVAIKIMNDSKVGFDNAITSLENPEENLFMNSYLLLTPRASPIENTALNAYKTPLLDTPFFVKKSTVDFRSIKITPSKTGTGTLVLKISDNRAKVFEKTFTINVASDKKMDVQYMKGTEFSADMPDLVSGKPNTLTVKVYNTQNNLEIQDAIVKIYDRFGTKLLEKTTNKLGLATIIIPASFPGEKLKLKIEKPEYETYLKDFSIAEDVITVSPTELAFTVNPQNNPQDTKTVKITNNTGLDLTIKSITLTGKLKGLLNTSQIESWFNTFEGKTIKSQDYEEIDFKVISAADIPAAADLEGVFEIMVGAEGKEWVKSINAKIRVGLGKDVDNPSCLEITQTNWQANTQGGQAETSFSVKNNCLVDGKPVALKYLGASINSQENTFGSFQVQSATSMVELGSNYARVFRTIIDAGEKVPVTVRFIPYGGASGTATGSITFEAQNPTDSTSQKVTAELKYNINVEDVKQCIVLGADLVTISSGGTGSFSITNNCKTAADIQLEKDSLQVSSDRLTLQPGQGKDITITRNQGDIPGAYNILVHGRKTGTRLELIGNVKVILESEGCFSLSRYEYDVYDSPLNSFDGVDRGYLRNTCVQKTTSAKVTGKIPFDTKNMTKMMLWGAVMGWLGHLTNKDKTSTENNDWLNKKQTENNPQYLNRVGITADQKAAEAVAANAAASSALQQSTKTQSQIAAESLDALNKKLENLQKTIDEQTPAPDAKANQSGATSSPLPSVENNTIKQKILFADPPAAKPASQQEDCTKALDSIKSEIKTLIEKVSELSKKLKEEDKQYEAKVKEINDGAAGEQKKEQAARTKKLNALSTQAAKGIATQGKGSYADRAKAIITASDQVVKSIAQEAQQKIAKETERHDEEVGKIMESSTKLGVEIDELTKKALEAKTAQGNCMSAAKKTGEDKKSFLRRSVDGLEALVNKVFGIVTENNTALGLRSAYRKTAGATYDLMKNWTPDWAPGGARTIQGEIETRQNDLDVELDYIKNLSKDIDSLKAETLGLEEQRAIAEVAGSSPDLDSIGKKEAAVDKKIVAKQNEFLGHARKIQALLNEITKLQRKGNALTIQGILVNEELINKAKTTTAGLMPSAQFILASGTGAQSYNNQTTAENSNQSVFSNAIMQSLGPLMAGTQFSSWWGGALAGALTNGLLMFMTGQDKVIDYSDSFVVPLVEINPSGITLTSPDGIAMSVGEKTYDYLSYTGSSGTTSTGATTSTTGTTSGSAGSSYTGNVLYNPQALSATIGQTEIYELEFTNPSGAKNKTVNQPFIAQLIVSGTENIYNTEYKYDYVKQRAKARGELNTTKSSGIWGIIKDFFRPMNSSTEEIAQITDADLTVKETRNYEKKFRLLFNSFEALECGPTTYPCPPVKLSDCEVEGKSGVTGDEGVPRIKLSWMWGSGNEISGATPGIGIQECDSDYNPNYHYCDSVQLTIEVLKKLLWMQEFFKTNNLSNCPTGSDYLTPETQKLDPNSLDVGITSITAQPASGGGVKLTATVETNNNQDIKTKVKFKFTDDSGNEIRNVCQEQEKTFRSSTNFECNADTTTLGQGKFNVEAALNGLVLCSSGCENNNTSNDVITTFVAVGSASTMQECKAFVTNREYFEKVLSANGLMANENGKKILQYISFKANLVRDAVSEDFKDDLDAYLDAVAQAPPEYAGNGIRELFLSNKFRVDWPTKPDAWKAGKYDAELLVKFKEKNWKWDNNNIESITLKLSPQGQPDPVVIGSPIYNVAFDGMVGMNSDNGRQGYGAGFEQLDESVFQISKDGSTTILAQKNAKSNPVTVVSLGVKKGTEAFTILNSSPTRGNVLNISGVNNVEMTITPSVAVPLVLTIDDSDPFATDAYAFYSAEVNGQPQETGAAFMIWNGIGQGCVDFRGGSMKNYSNQYDAKASTYITGFDKSYGWYWPMITNPGKVSMYSSFFAPQDTQTILKIIGQSKTAIFESTYGTGDISVNTAGAGIKTLQDVFNLVKAKKVCVVGGEYYWNNNGLREDMISQINAKEQTCIPSRQ